MQSSFEYRAYGVRAENGVYIATALDGDDQLTLRTKYLLRLLRAVDAIWASLDVIEEPELIPIWVRTWLSDPAVTNVDLDDADEASGLPAACCAGFTNPIKVLSFPKKPVLQVVAAAAGVSAVAPASALAS